MNLTLFIQAIAPLIPTLVNIVEKTVPGKRKGRTKKSKVMRAVKELSGAMPILIKQSKELGALIDNAVAEMNAKE